MQTNIFFWLERVIFSLLSWGLAYFQLDDKDDFINGSPL